MNYNKLGERQGKIMKQRHRHKKNQLYNNNKPLYNNKNPLHNNQLKKDRYLKNMKINFQIC